MRSHDFAKNLILMAKILKSGPNVELENLNLNESFSDLNKKDNLKKHDVPKALSLLVGLNQISKAQWLDLIREYDFKVPTRDRDANRDIIGKLLKYLSENPSERDRLTGKKTGKTIGSSSELADALSILLR